MITSIWTKPGQDASTAQALRRAVFCQELGLDEALAWDDSDAYAFHLVLMLDGTPVAAGRLSYGGVGVAALGRICVAKRYRRQGIGDGLVKILDFKAATMALPISQVEAPETLMGFYTRLGYTPAGPAISRWGLTLTPMRKETNDGTRENCAHQCPGPQGQD